MKIFEIFQNITGTNATKSIQQLFMHIQYIYIIEKYKILFDKGNNKITELRTILQRESQNS
jgi:hypothetical protein